SAACSAPNDIALTTRSSVASEPNERVSFEPSVSPRCEEPSGFVILPSQAATSSVPTPATTASDQNSVFIPADGYTTGSRWAASTLPCAAPKGARSTGTSVGSVKTPESPRRATCSCIEASTVEERAGDCAATTSPASTPDAK